MTNSTFAGSPKRQLGLGRSQKLRENQLYDWANILKIVKNSDKKLVTFHHPVQPRSARGTQDCASYFKHVFWWQNPPIFVALRLSLHYVWLRAQSFLRVAKFWPFFKTLTLSIFLSCFKIFKINTHFGLCWNFAARKRRSFAPAYFFLFRRAIWIESILKRSQKSDTEGGASVMTVQ